jgi:hypothetical protein
MTQYFIHDGNAERGPFTLQELKGQLVQSETPVWYSGLSTWTIVGNVPELEELLQQPPPFRASHSTAANSMSSPALEASVVTPSAEHATAAPPPQPRKRFPVAAAAISGGVLVAVIVTVLLNRGGSTSPIVDGTTTAISPEIRQAVQDVQQEEAQRKEEERQRINAAITEKNMRFRNNWSEYITAQSNIYSVGGFGGISNLYITFQNNTDYTMDEAVAYVTYIKANGEIWKTKEAAVQTLPAHSTKSVGLPDVDRGVKIEVSMKSILSRKMHFLMSPEYSSGNPEDPFFYKD